MDKRKNYLASFFKGIAIFFILPVLFTACNLDGDIGELRQKPGENPDPNIPVPGKPVIISGINQLTVYWEGSSGISSYEVYINTTTTAPSSPAFATDKTNAVINNLENDVPYYIWIRAVNNARKSGYSLFEAGTPRMPTTAPAAPAVPILTAGNNELTVSWHAVEGAGSYEVWMGTTNNSASANIYGTDISDTTMTLTSLANGTTYYVWLKAKNPAGTSVFSPSASGKPLGTPGLPTLSSGYKQILVTWTAVAGADEYEVYYGTGTPATLAAITSGTSTTIAGLKNSTTYSIRLRAKNANGISEYGPIATETPDMTPGLYRGTVKIGSQNLSSSLSYISTNAQTGDDFYIVLGEDEYAPPMNLNFSGKTVGITLLGYGGERTITLNSNGSLFTVNTGVTLTLDENITLVGRSTNNNSLVYIDSGKLIINDGAKISGNTSDFGGGICVSSGTLTMNGGTISGNTASSGGGGIVVLSGGTFTMNGGTINGNECQENYGGGGIFVFGGTLTMYDGVINRNTATRFGGGVHVYNNNSFIGSFTMHGGTISGNTANSGGGIDISNGTFTMHGGTISGNTARGGGINSSGTVTMNGGTISGNKSYNQGGGVEVSGGTFTMHGGIISGNTASNVGGGIYVNSSASFKKLPSGSGQNSGIIYGSEETRFDAYGIPLRNICGGDGAAVYPPSTWWPLNNTVGQTAHIDSTTGMGLSASNVPSVASGLYRGSEKIGNHNLSAALSYISSNAVSGDNFSIVLGSNESASPINLNYQGKTVGITLLGTGGERTITLTSNGSLFTINSGVTLTLDENITLVGINTNSAALVRINTNGIFIMNSGTICRNTTNISDGSNYGGGIYVYNGTLTMNGGTISENTADSGGGIYVYRGTLTMNGGIISRNTSSNAGGGIYANNNGNIIMNNGTINGNQANYGGGILVTGTVTMNGGIISGNTGGGIYVSGSGNGTFTMHSGTISGNTGSGNGGGGIYVDNNGTITMHGGTISGNTANFGGGIYVNTNSGGIFKKLPGSGGQNSGIIYGNEETGFDAGGAPLKNTSGYSIGHAVYLSSMRRNATAGQTDHIDTETGRGLSSNGSPPYGQ